MRARLYCSESIYEVRSDEPVDGIHDWWIATKVPGGWMIVDLLGQTVSAASELGQKIVSAITAAISEDVNA